MSVWRALTFISCLFVSSALAAEEDGLPFTDKASCMQGPLEQFGRYIGDWKIRDSTLAQDGSGWADGKGARWIFKCLGNGVAIQDFWLPAGGAVGTNLRTYKAETGTWEIAWTIDKLPGFTHIRAEEDGEGNIVMDFVAPIPTPLRKITFLPPDENGWNWKLELSNDAGETWFEVYRIQATPFVAE
jgi:hypothetical protein